LSWLQHKNINFHKDKIKVTHFTLTHYNSLLDGVIQYLMGDEAE